MQLLAVRLGQQGRPVLRSLSCADRQQSLCDVDVLDAQLAALGDAQAAAVDERGHQARRAAHRPEERRRFRHAQHRRQPLTAFRSHNRGNAVDPRAKDFAAQEHHRRHRLVLRAGRHPPVDRQVRQEVPRTFGIHAGVERPGAPRGNSGIGGPSRRSPSPSGTSNVACESAAAAVRSRPSGRRRRARRRRRSGAGGASPCARGRWRSRCGGRVRPGGPATPRGGPCARGPRRSGGPGPRAAPPSPPAPGSGAPTAPCTGPPSGGPARASARSRRIVEARSPYRAHSLAAGMRARLVPETGPLAQVTVAVRLRPRSAASARRGSVACQLFRQSRLPARSSCSRLLPNPRNATLAGRRHFGGGTASSGPDILSAKGLVAAAPDEDNMRAWPVTGGVVRSPRTNSERLKTSAYWMLHNYE
jgi:hypothetical protein